MLSIARRPDTTSRQAVFAPGDRLLPAGPARASIAIMPAGAGWVIGRGVRPTLERLVVLVCPPELTELGLTESVIRDLELHLRCLPPAARRLTGPALRLFDQAARLRPTSRGLRFAQLDGAKADAYLREVLYGRRGPVATVVRLIKGLVVMCYFELPEVKAALGYDPDPYVAQVAARRLALHGPSIQAAERADG